MAKLATRSCALLLSVLLCLAANAADWPQFMRNSEHTGDAADEALEMPLGLIAQVKLDDAATTSPAVVGGRVYAVDQMGAAYCVDPRAGRILWKSSPDGDQAMGSNTSSPCVVKGRVYYGTTAGTFHVLDAADGRRIKTLPLGSPVISAPTLANDSVYVQTVDAVLHCLDLDGSVRWTWDHYKRYAPPLPERLKNYHPRSYDRPHFGGRDVAVSGRRIVTAMGWDQVCLEDRGSDAALLWCNRAALGKDDGIPCSASIAGGYIYTAWPGVDGAGSVVRFLLADGSFEKGDQRSDQWGVLGTPAVRGATVFWGRHIRGVTAYEYGKGTQWESFHWGSPAGFTPVITSPALARDHCLFTTLDGELIAVPLTARGSDLRKLRPEPFRLRTPHGKAIGSSPAVADGCVYFGCDDGYLYALGPGGTLQPKSEKLTLHEPRSKTAPATGRRYAWPSPYGSPANTNFVDDPEMRPPFRLRWAIRSLGFFKQPVSATEDDVVYVTLSGTVVCLEQGTARMRWRRRLPGPSYVQPGVLCADGRIYVPRPRQSVKPGSEPSRLYCLDGSTGETIWEADLGMGGSSRAAPALCEGVVAFGSRKEAGPVVEAWDAATGKPVWQVPLDANAGNMGNPSGCADGGVFYFTVGVAKWGWKPLGDKPRGQTLAIEAKTGKVLWTTAELFGCGSATPALRGGRLYLIEEQDLLCLSAAQGKLLWRDRIGMWFHNPSLGPDYLTGRGYSGHAERRSLEDGKTERRGGKAILLGGPEHACGPVLLTASGLSLAVTVGGLYTRDVRTGELLWLSPGFAPRACSSPAAANGRLFYNPQADGVLYCFEPAGRD